VWGAWDILRAALAIVLALLVLAAASCNAYYAYRVYVRRTPSPSPIPLVGSIAACALAWAIPHISELPRIIVALAGIFVSDGVAVLGALGTFVLRMRR
jgi:hypothetical protein